MEGSRLCFSDILQTPEFIFEETQAQADVLRNVLVIDNLEEKMYVPLKSGINRPPLLNAVIPTWK